MHSSREAFSSLHTQQGFTFAVASPGGFRSLDDLEAVGGVVGEGEKAGDDIVEMWLTEWARELRRAVREDGYELLVGSL